MRRWWTTFIGYGVIVPMAMVHVAYAQHGYQVGLGQASIEPGQQTLSLALAGYGLPRDGRFSLEWRAYSDLGETTDAAMADGKLFVVREGRVWYADLADKAVEMEMIAVDHADQIQRLAAGRKKLFALNTRNELLEASISTRGRTKWKRKGQIVQTPRALSYWDSRLVLLDEKGKLWTAKVRRGPLEWSAWTVCEGAIDIMADQHNLYVLTDKQEILRYEATGEWIRVAKHNGITYNQDIRLVMASGTGFWAVDSAGILYEAAHNSVGQLTVGALIIQQGRTQVAIIAMDVCGFNDDFATSVKQKIQRQFGIPPEAVMINASHTHFAPVTQRWTTWGPHCQKPDSAYLHGVVSTGIMDAMRQADGSRQAASLFMGRTTVNIGHNRSLPGTDPPYDNALDVVRIKYNDLAKGDVIFLTGCHPVSDNSGKEDVTLSPNYPGVARELLIHHSEVRSAMFLQGCGGDINPVDVDHHVTAQKVAKEVGAVLDRDALQPINGAIEFYLDTVRFDSRPRSEAEIRDFRMANEGQDGNVGAEKNVRWADLMLQYMKNNEMPQTMPVFIQTFNIGNWKLVGLSRETTTEYSLGIKSLWPDQLVSVAGYCNDVSSYLPTSKHIRAGTYEGYDSFFWYGQPNSFPHHVYETIIESIKIKNR